MKIRFDTRALCCLSLLAIWLPLVHGCVEPNYRTNVAPNGQGGVDVQRVAKEPVPALPVTPPLARDAGDSGKGTFDQRIDRLEARDRELNNEITRLKLEKAAQDPAAQ